MIAAIWFTLVSCFLFNTKESTAQAMLVILDYKKAVVGMLIQAIAPLVEGQQSMSGREASSKSHTSQ